MTDIRQFSMGKPHGLVLQHRDDLAPSQMRRVAGFEPRQRHPNEALPCTISFRDRGDYVPPSMEPIRAGASDHLKHRSRGIG